MKSRASVPYRPKVLTLLGGALGALLIAASGCRQSAAPADGAARMAERLRLITRGTDPMDNIFMNAARATRLEKEVAAKGNGAPPLMLRNLAVEMLNAGRVDDSLALFGHLDDLMRAQQVAPGSRTWVDLRLQEGIANLRRGEVQNCAEHHNARSCLFPISGSGVHGLTGGSEAAYDILIDLLQHAHDDLSARWLLNIAAMTLGRYPDGVPKAWLLPPDLFRSDYDIGRFPDVAADVGLDIDELAGGSILEDFDGDGNLDLMISSMGFESQLRYFRNNGDGTFTERTQEAGLVGEIGGLNIMQTDYDNDGWLDVLVLRGGWMGKAGHYPPSLLHNDGGRRFTDVTETAGLLHGQPTQTAAWLDYDGDGWLDLYIGTESTEGDQVPALLYHNDRNGTFSECAADAGVAAVGVIKGVTAGDYNNDGRPDLYLSIRESENVLYRNGGPSEGLRARKPGCGWHFTNVAREAHVTEPISSFPTWFFDYDNDGNEDLFVSGYLITELGDITRDVLGLPTDAERPRLYHNNGDGTFADVTRVAHLDHVLQAMGSNYGDFDNDGWLDMLIGTGNPDLGTLIPDRAFRNDGGRLFQDVTTSGGFGHLQKGHGVSFGDIDNDGDQDIYHVIGGALESDHFRHALYENPGHGNHFLVLRLEGVRSNRAAIGARIKVIVSTPHGVRAIWKTVRSGGSFGASPLRQEIGLGDAQRIERIDILWPSGGLSRLGSLGFDQRYVIREGATTATPFMLRPFRLGGAAAAQRRADDD